MLQKRRFCLVLLFTVAWLVCMSLSMNQALAVNKIPLTVAAVCMNAAEDKEANLQTFFSYMKKASAKGVHLIVFPEIALQQNPGWGTSSYKPTQQQLDYVHDTAETIPGDSTEKLVNKAKELNIHVVFGMTEKSPDDDSLFNSSVFLGPSGVIGKYRKINLWDASIKPTGGNEQLYWKCGSEIGVFDSPIGKVGLMIYIDMGQFLGNTLAKEGAELLVTVAAWPVCVGEAYENLSKQNALQAKSWHIVSDQVGTVGQYAAYGHSRIIAPNGNVMADTGPTEGMVVAETNLLIDASVVGVDASKLALTWAEVKSF